MVFGCVSSMCSDCFYYLMFCCFMLRCVGCFMVGVLMLFCGLLDICVWSLRLLSFVCVLLFTFGLVCLLVCLHLLKCF